jgi:hypothetical protein
MKELEQDLWRLDAGFSPEVKSALDAILRPEEPEESVVDVLNDWLARYQPCLFGRIAAKKGLISYCLIGEEELSDCDEALAEKIQAARREWTRAGFEGKASAFVIIVRSRRLATALPGQTVKSIASRLCSLYLQEEVLSDKIYLDRIYLEQPGSRHTTWEWVTGVNYFSAQGDRRWWQDHRIPAGMAFSVNSVGHMAKAGRLARAMRDLEDAMGTVMGDFANPKVDSLEKALELAMRTIDSASDGPSGKATMLRPLPSDVRGMPRCPIELPPFLADKDYCRYRGHYHTDYTLPSEYFLPDVQRPPGLIAHDLDFTYLFDQSLDNPDFDRTGTGRIIREPSAASDEPVSGSAYRWQKRSRGEPTEVDIDHVPRLQEALGND